MKGGSHIVINLLTAPLVAYAAIKVVPNVSHPVIAALVVASGVILSAKLPDQVEFLKFLGHRTWSHSVLIAVIVLGCMVLITGIHWVPRFALLGITAGYLTHLLADMFSVSGVPLLIGGLRLRVPLYTTGNISELLVLVLLGSLLITADLHITPIRTEIARITDKLTTTNSASPKEIKLHTNVFSNQFQ